MSDQVLRQQDADARKLARREFEKPVVLEAGAGTGKTATLVARVLVWALGPGWIKCEERSGLADHQEIAARVLDGIVAITFTEKAAVEMAERLAEATHDVIQGKAVIGIDADDLPAPGIAENRAKAILTQLDRIHVETIHAFCRRVLSDHALAAGLHPSFEVDADAKMTPRIIRETMETWFDEAFGKTPSDDAAFLMRQGIGPGRLEACVNQILQAGVAESVLIDDPYPAEACQEAARQIASSMRALLGFAHETFTNAKGKAFETTRECIASLSDIATSLELAKNPNEIAEALSQYDRKGKHKRIQEWATKGANVGHTKALVDAGLDPTDLQHLSESLQQLVGSAVDWNPEILRPAFRVLAPLVTTVRHELRKRGVLGFNDLLRSCHRLLTNDESVADILRSTIDQLLVDEVQDTDPLQYDIVRALAFDHSNAPGLFVVGDPKQTIYGFRQADLGAYESFLDEIKERDGEVRLLSVNFRSHSPILEEVERIISPVMLPDPKLQPSFQKLLCSSMNEGKVYSDTEGRQAVEHWNSWSRDAVDQANGKSGAKTGSDKARHIEAKNIAREIRQLHDHHGAKFNDFAILFKVTTQQEIYLSALRDEGIPYLVEKDKQFFRRREVIDATSALLTVLDPNDQLSLLGWLRSSVVGLPDAAIVPLWQRGFPHLLAGLGPGDKKQLEEARRVISEVATAGIPTAGGADRLSRWAELLQHNVESLSVLRRSIEQETVPSFLGAFRKKFPFEVQESSRFLGAHRVANLERFFDRAAQVLSDDSLTRDEQIRSLRSDVLDAVDMEEASPGDETADAVRVMSIHKSKGLDFNQVYLPSLHQKRRNEGNEDRILYRDGTYGFRFFGITTPHFFALNEHRKRVEAAETVRTLYVGITRPKNRLVLCGIWPNDSKPAPGFAGSSTLIDLISNRVGAFRDWQNLDSQFAEAEQPRQLAEAEHTQWLMPDCRIDVSGSQQKTTTDSNIRLQTASVQELAEAKTRAKEIAQILSPIAATSFVAKEQERTSKIVTKKLGGNEPLRWPPTKEANIVGTAVHRVLEWTPLGDELTSFFEDAHKNPGRFLGGRQDDSLVETFRAQLSALENSPLLHRLRASSDLVVGREIPLLTRIGDVDVVGSIDLLYRDADDQLVIVDFKTDAISTEAEAAERAREYQSQADAYRAGIQGAWPKENPRLELWFLSADIIVSFED